MPDYNEMAYFQMKTECKKQGLNAKGTKEQLLSRLNGEAQAKTPEEPKPQIKAPLPTTPKNPVIITEATEEELAQFLPKASHTPKIDTSKYKPWLTNERLQELENQIAPIASGRGKFRFDINHEKGAFQVEFSGGAAGLESTTLIDTDSQIVRRAQHYFTARLAQGGNGQKSRI